MRKWQSNQPPISALLGPMKLFWNDNEELSFNVHRKEGQVLKYLNSDITHPSLIFRAIPTAVLTRVASLTTSDEMKITN
jgi:hypothetical protein